MKRFFSGSFVRTAVFFIITAAIPALGIVVFTGAERNARCLHDAESEALSSVLSVAHVQRTVTAGSETLLSTLAEAGAVDCESASLLAYLYRLRNEHPAFAEVFIVDRNGRTISAKLDPGAETLANDRLYFSRGMESDGLVAGEAVVSRIDGAPTFHFAHQLTCGSGEKAVLVTSLRLEYYDRFLRGLTLPEGATLYLADEAGRALFSRPEAPPLTPVPAEVLQQVQGAAEPQGFFYTDLPSGRHLVAYEKLFLASAASTPYMQVIMTVPQAVLQAEASAGLFWDVALLTIAFAATVAVSVLLIRAVVMPPLRKMLHAARLYGKGDYSERVDLAGSCREFVELGRSMNAMADALDKREKDLVGARESAETAGKSKSEFLANMSHEVRTPMNAIIGMAYLSLKGELTEQQRGYVTRIHEAGSSLLRIINDILELSRLDAGKLTVEKLPFDLHEFLADLQGKYAPQTKEKGLSLDFSIQPNVPTHVVGDPLRLDQVLVNLLDNALHFTDSGGISVFCELAEKAESRVVLRLTIKDTGQGMRAEQTAALEEIFRGESAALPESLSGSSGKGFGLVLANRLLHLMGGSLSVTSEPGLGASFVVTVGLHIRAGSRGSREADLLHNIRLLLVDSEADDVASLQGQLANFGMDVSVENQAPHAFTHLSEADASGRPFDLVILPWRMPGQDGMEMTRHIKEGLSLSRIPRVIMLSAYSWAGIATLADQAGADAFLHKPVNESVILDTIMNLLQLQSVKPAARDEEHAGNAPALPAGMKVLVVEDNSVNQQIAEEILSDAGLAVTLADNGEAALALLPSAAAEAPFAVVLMDLQMPVLDGFEATRRLRALPAPWALDLPVIAMTAHSRDAEFNSAKAAGMDDHVAKPIAVEDLFGTLRRWLPLGPLRDEGAAGTLRDIYARLLQEDSSVLSAIVEAKDLLERCLYAGRAARLLEMVHEGRFKEAAAFLRHADTALSFLREETV